MRNAREDIGPSNEVVIATTMRGEGTTGVHTHIREFAGFLQGEGIAHAVATPYSVPALVSRPALVLGKLVAALGGAAKAWSYRRTRGALLAAALKRRLRDGAPRVIYAQCPLAALGALRARVGPHQRVVLAIHFNISEAREWAEKGLIAPGAAMFRAIETQELEALRSADAVVCFSAFTRAQVEAKGISRAGIAVLPSFIADPGEPRAARPAADLVAIGSFEPRKNQQFILDVLAAAKARGSRLTATLIGDGPDRPGAEQRAQRLGIADQVRFAGALPNAANAMEGHRALIHAAHVESFGLVVVEAMARGMPVFAPPSGALPELFSDRVEGRYLVLDDPEESASRILAALRDEEALSAMGQAARRRFNECFERAAVGPRLLDVLFGR